MNPTLAKRYWRPKVVFAISLMFLAVLLMLPQVGHSAPLDQVAGSSIGFLSDDPAYVKTIAPGYDVMPLITTGEDVPRLGGRLLGDRYRFVGIPDGIAAHKLGGMVAVYVNHEIPNNVATAPYIKADGTSEGDLNGSLVSLLLLDPKTASVTSGRVAFADVIAANGSVAGNAGAAAVAFGRFCSGSIVGPALGFDRYMYITGEEGAGTATMDKKGGQMVAIFDNHAYLLPQWGRFPHENAIVLPGTGNTTAVMLMEDGPTTPDSQLYMYVGKKDPASTNPLVKNGMVNGDLYALRSKNFLKNNEAAYHMSDGVLDVEWVKITGADAMDETALGSASSLANAFGFIRAEDGTADPVNKGLFYFDTTGTNFKNADGTYANRIGRIYKLVMDPANPLAGGKLQAVVESDREPDSRKVVNPDNLDLNAQGVLLIQEDGTADGEVEMARMGRDASIWAYNTRTGGLERIVEMDQTVAVSAPEVTPFGSWETSGVFDTSSYFGRWTWLIDVQAHGVNSIKASAYQGLTGDAKLAEGGQLLLLSKGKRLPLGNTSTYIEPEFDFSKIVPTVSPQAAVLPAPIQQAAKFTVALWGDVPYAKNNETVDNMNRLVNDVNSANVAFSVFDGDLKDGSSKCTDDQYTNAVATYSTFAKPMVYLPGDNEWTDCHRTNNGSYNALERLDFIRKTMFKTLEPFGKSSMAITHQGAAQSKFVENMRWTYGGVVFAGINMPGSNNNKVGSDCVASNTTRAQAECDADNAEYLERDAANIKWIQDAFALAKSTNASGVMIIAQADPSFDFIWTTANEHTAFANDGYDKFIDALTIETLNFKGQVVYVHGDSHNFLVDKPMFSKGSVVSNFTRVMTIGEAQGVHWVKATIDPSARNVFSFEPMIVPGN